MQVGHAHRQLLWHLTHGQYTCVLRCLPIVIPGADAALHCMVLAHQPLPPCVPQTRPFEAGSANETPEQISFNDQVLTGASVLAMGLIGAGLAVLVNNPGPDSGVLCVWGGGGTTACGQAGATCP